MSLQKIQICNQIITKIFTKNIQKIYLQLYNLQKINCNQLRQNGGIYKKRV